MKDGRPQGVWKPRYTDAAAKRRIRLESAYVAMLFVASPVLLIAIWDGAGQELLDLDADQNRTFQVYGYAWVSGMLGGTAFTTKWLYHSVAKGTWHFDRTVWRIYTPLLSAGFALAVVALATSGIVDLLDAGTLRRPPAVVGIGFLVGYFSDYTAAALADVARHLLGDPEKRRAARQDAERDEPRDP